MSRKSEMTLLAGLTSLAAAAVSAQFAWRHIQTVQLMGPICGEGAAPHCAWCPATLGFLALGLLLLTAAAGRGLALRQCEAVKPD